MLQSLTAAFSHSNVRVHPQVSEKFFKRNMPPMAPTEFLHNNENTINLANALNVLEKNTTTYREYYDLAMLVINQFALLPIKNPEDVKEISALGIVNNLDICIELLEQLIVAIKTNVFLSPVILDGLTTVLSNVHPDSIDADIYVQLLKILRDRLEGMHKIGTEKKMLNLLQAIAQLLDVMVDANIKGLERVTQHEALYNLVGSISTEDPVLCWYIAYMQQALIRIPNDETKLACCLRRTWALTHGVFTIKSIVTNMDIRELLDVFNNFSEAFAIQTLKKLWYEELRVIDSMIQLGKFADSEAFILHEKRSHSRSEKNFTLGLIYYLFSIAENHPEVDIQESAAMFLYSILKDVFSEKMIWCDDAKIQESLQNGFIHLANSSNEELRKIVLQLIQNIKNTLKEKAPKIYIFDIAHIDVQRTGSLMTLPVRLIQAAKNQPINAQESRAEFALIKELIASTSCANPRESVKQKLEALRMRVLLDSTIQDELALYIPARGASLKEQQNIIDLENSIIYFFNQAKEAVYLLLGEAGSGKSTLGRYMQRKSWETYTPGNPIFIYIFLPSLSHFDHQWLQEYFTREGFSQEEMEILSTDYSWQFYLDAYDEVGKFINFYTLAQLSRWTSAKALISCRTSYLTGRGAYQHFFSPYNGERPLLNMLSEWMVVLFNFDQIRAYVIKYIELNRHHLTYEWDNIEKYMHYINTIPGLNTLIQNPFLLRITMEVLPRIVSEFEKIQDSQEKEKLTKTKIYDEFTQQWFEREENKLLLKGKLPDDGRDVKVDFEAFAENLAVEMYNAGPPYQAYYVPTSALFSNTNSRKNKWEEFFSYQNPDMVRARKACPLRRDGAKFFFMHDSLLDYFYTKAISTDFETVDTPLIR